MKNSTLVIGAGLLGAAYLATKGFNTAQGVYNLEYSNPKVKLGKITPFTSELHINLDFRNNSSQAIAMEYFTGNIKHTGRIFSSFTFDGKGKNIVLKARSVTNVPFTVIVKNAAALSTLKQLAGAVFANKKLDTIVNIDSRFYAAGLDVPVAFNWDLKTNSLVSTPKKVSGIGSNDHNKYIPQNGIVVTWSYVDRLFYVYLDGVEIGYQQKKPTREDLKAMYLRSANSVNS